MPPDNPGADDSKFNPLSAQEARVILGSAEERWDGPSGCARGRYPAPPSIAAPQDPQM